ncbi:MAG: VWA domain-containing protein [Acidobacteriota bacterium]
MVRGAGLLLLAVAGLLPAEDVVFKTGVSLARVDAQVVDRDNRAITGLNARDFVLKEDGRPQEIRNFASEDMPVDVLLLLDVSASMRPHVETIASAARQAFRVLSEQDRVAIMVFDRSTRLRLPFRSDKSEAEREFEALLRDETFRGGTDITRGMLDAAAYVGREGRRDARHAIVILTDDRTERDRDDEGVGRALAKADTVMSALIAPDAMRHGGGMGRGGGWPGGGGGGGWPGGVILGRPRGPYGGRGPGGPGGGGVMMHPTKSAGTSEIARASGGDSMPAGDASALESTLSRIRQRYALHFNLPPGAKPGEERGVEVELADAARSRYPGAEVRYRRVYITPSAGAEPAVASSDSSTTPPKRRPAVNGPVSEGPAIGSSAPAPAAQPQPDQSSGQPGGGWRRVKPGEQ